MSYLLKNRNKIISTVFVLTVIWLFGYLRIVGIILEPNKELWMSTSNTQSYIEKKRIEWLLIRGANPNYEHEGRMSSIQFAVINKNIWLTKKLLPYVSSKTCFEMVQLAIKKSHHRDFISSMKCNSKQ